MNRTRHQARRRGFTLVEVMVASSVFLLVVGGVLTTFVVGRKLWIPSTYTMGANQSGAGALARMVYGPNNQTNGLRGAIGRSRWYWSNGDSWTIGFNTNRWIMYDGVSNVLSDSVLGLLCDNVISSTATVSLVDCAISLHVVEGSGRYAITNRLYTRISFRN